MNTLQEDILDYGRWCYQEGFIHGFITGTLITTTIFLLFK